MEDIKNILVFIGFSFQRFFIHLIANFAYLLLVITITIVVFLLSYNAFKNHYFFIFYLFALLALNYIVRHLLFFKNQLRLNLGFIHFLDLDNDKKQDYLRVKIVLPANASQRIKTAKEHLKKGGVRFISKKLLLAVAAMQIKNGGVEGDGFISKKRLKRSRKLVIKVLFFQLFAFFVLLVPFALISFFFTMGQAVSVKYIIYLLGFFFVYFLNAAIAEPIAGLMIQEKVYGA